MATDIILVTDDIATFKEWDVSLFFSISERII